MLLLSFFFMNPLNFFLSHLELLKLSTGAQKYEMNMIIQKVLIAQMQQ